MRPTDDKSAQRRRGFVRATRNAKQLQRTAAVAVFRPVHAKGVRKRRPFAGSAPNCAIYSGGTTPSVAAAFTRKKKRAAALLHSHRSGTQHRAACRVRDCRSREFQELTL
jgi:hypothetical protein